MSNTSSTQAILISGYTALTTDTALDAWAMGETLALNASPVTATFIAIGVGLIYLALKIAFFKMGLGLAEDLSHPRRTLCLTLVFVFATCFAGVSAYFNLDRLAGDKMKEAHTQQQFDKRTNVKGNIEQAFKQSFDQKPNIQSVHDTAKSWKQCEITNACISGQGSGEGPISSLLSGFMSSTHNAIDALTDLEADLEPLTAKANHLITLYEEVETIADFSFDQKEERRNQLSEELHQIVSEMQALIPYGLFNGLTQELGKSAATYRALSISDAAAKRLRTKFEPLAEEFKRQAEMMRQASKWYLPPIKKPSQLEVMSASSDVIVFWIMSIALAFGVWIMLFIHVVSIRDEAPEIQTMLGHNDTQNTKGVLSDEDIIAKAQDMIALNPKRSVLQVIKEASQVLSAEKFGEIKRIGDSRAKKLEKQFTK